MDVQSMDVQSRKRNRVAIGRIKPEMAEMRHLTTVFDKIRIMEKHMINGR